MLNPLRLDINVVLQVLKAVHGVQTLMMLLLLKVDVLLQIGNRFGHRVEVTVQSLDVLGEPHFSFLEPLNILLQLFVPHLKHLLLGLKQNVFVLNIVNTIVLFCFQVKVKLLQV